MHETIENVIKKNLPEKKEECPEYPCQKCNGLGYTAEHDLPSRHGEDGECVSCPIQVQCEECQATGMIGFLDDKNIGFNQALSQIDTSLIADEVLKVVVEKIKDDIQKYLLEKHIHFEKEDNLDFVEEKPYIDSLEFEKWLLQLLSNLSPNKENKNI